MHVSSTLVSATKGQVQILYGAEASITAAQVLYQRAKINPTGVAFVLGNSAKTYEWLAEKTARLACGFISRSVKRGDRVLLHLPSRAEFVIASYACFHIGAIAVPLKTRLKTAELSLLLKRLGPALYIWRRGLPRRGRPHRVLGSPSREAFCRWLYRRKSCAAMGEPTE